MPIAAPWKWLVSPDTPYTKAMPPEYDFSKGVRGKFYRENVALNLPIQIQAIQEGIKQADEGQMVPHEELRAKWEKKLAGAME